MSEYRPTMMDPPIEKLLEKVDSKFTLVTLTAQRARQINAYFSQLSGGLGTIVPPQVPSLSHKPVSIALDEIEQNRIVAVYHRDEESAEAVEADGAAPGPVLDIDIAPVAALP